MPRSSTARSASDARADTTTAHGVADADVLGGLDRAKACGQHMRHMRHMRRPPKLTPQQQKEPRARVAAGETQRSIARSYNISQATISRLAG